MDDSRVTYAELAPARLAAGAEYATVSQILGADDLQQTSVYVPHWRAWIRVRALCLSEREQIQKAPTLEAQYCVTWQLGCVVPRFTSDQAQRLVEKNPEAVEKVARLIWFLAAIDQDWIERVVEARTDAEPAEVAPIPDADADAGSRADTAHPARVRRVA